MNSYTVNEKVVTMYDSRGRKTIFDLEDFEKVSSIGATWYAEVNPKTGKVYWLCYLYPEVEGIKKKLKIRLHNFILDRDSDRYNPVDHRNGDSTDNRKSNLRVCLPQTNVQNTSRYCVHGFYGISRSSTNPNSWIAKLQFSSGAIMRFCSTSKSLSAIAYDKFCFDNNLFENSNLSQNLLKQEDLRFFGFNSIEDVTIEKLKEIARSLVHSRKTSVN